MSRIARCAILLVVASAGSSPAWSQQTLHWKFQPRQRLDYVVEQTMKMTMTVNGSPVVTNMKQTINTAWLVRAVDSQGNAQLTQKITRIRLALQGGPLGALNYDSADRSAPPRPEFAAMTTVFDSLVQAEITAVMSPTGEILKLDVPEKLVKVIQESPGIAAANISEESLKQMFNQSGVVMSQTAVNPGDQWTSANQVTTPVGKMLFDTVLTFRGPEQVGGRQFARVDLKPNVRVEQNPESQVKLAVRSSSGKGAVLFDQQAGRVERTQLQSQMVMDVEQAGFAIEQVIDQTVSMRYVPPAAG